MKSTLLVLLLLPALLHGQWSTDPAVNTVLDKPGDQRAPLITTDGKGGAIVAWDEDSGVFANWIDKYGFRQWGNDGVRITPAGRIAFVTNIISDGHGGAVVVWEDLTHARQVGDEVVHIIENEMFVQHVDSAGQLVWDADGVAIRTKIDSTTIGSFRLVTSNHQDFILLWIDDRAHPYPMSGPIDFYAQKIDLSGNRLWQSNGELITVHGGLTNPRHRVVNDGAGGFLWAHFGEGNGNVVVERISSEGELLWQPGGIPVNTGGAFDMDSDGAGGAVVAGVFFPGAGVVQVRVQRVSPSGELLWGENAMVVTDEADLRTAPLLVLDGKAGAILYWNAENSEGRREGFFQHLDSSGVSLEDTVHIRFGFSSTIHPYFISDHRGGSILLANDFEGGFWGVRADFSGDLIWGQGVLFRQRAFNDWPFIFDTVADGSGGFIGTWAEFSSTSGSRDIFLQQVSAHGELGEVITAIGDSQEQSSPAAYALFQNYPNPFNPETQIRFNLKDSGLVSLKIYDLSGGEVITLIHQELPLGEHQVTWNGQNQKGGDVASGLYFYQLRAGSFVQTKKASFIK